jgi:lantibiotic leader peptide-processing serine protease
MRKARVLAATAAISLSVTALVSTTGASTAVGEQTSATTAKTSYVVLADKGYSAKALATTLRNAGAKVTSVNKAVGMVTVTSTKVGFATKTRRLDHVAGVARNRSIGMAPPTPINYAPKPRPFDRSRANGTGQIPAPPPGGDTFDGLLWGMEMIRAVEAHAVDQGDDRVTVGVLDTGIQGNHPDLAPNFDAAKSRNFTTDIPAIDGECEYDGCVDPANVDDDGHGTHVSGTIAAALNGRGVSGVAPDVTLVNIRGGQDSGFFFLAPSVNALTYAGDIGIDVVNMSFYVDPWLYNCIGGAPEDTAAQAAEQGVIIEAMNRALTYAHDHGVTLVGSLGNNHEDLSNPRPDTTSPDYPLGTEHLRTIDNDTCFDLPVEGPHVLGISALGPSGRKADYSNYATDLGSGEIELSAPGGWFRDGLGTDSFRTNGNLILSTAPKHVLQATGEVNKHGFITKLGRINGVLRECVNGSCAYYQWLQGTSMASPHATGVAALAVSAHGSFVDAAEGLTWAPDSVRALMMSSAIDHACPPGGVQSYVDVGRSEEFTATCNGTPEFNAFYGAGIVNALGAVQ